MIPTDVVACVDDLVTRVISDATGDYPGVHTRKQVIGNKMAFTEDVMTLMNAELTVAQNEMAECQAKTLDPQCFRNEPLYSYIHCTYRRALCTQSRLYK
eukprot:COSAG06_NODE_800_length_12197_cov_9.094974_3_plen_99_part_00